MHCQTPRRHSIKASFSLSRICLCSNTLHDSQTVRSWGLEVGARREDGASKEWREQSLRQRGRYMQRPVDIPGCAVFERNTWLVRPEREGWREFCMDRVRRCHKRNSDLMPTSPSSPAPRPKCRDVKHRRDWTLYRLKVMALAGAGRIPAGTPFLKALDGQVPLSL